MITPQEIHDLVRQNNYREAFDKSLQIEKEIGALRISFIKSRLLSSLSVILYLCFGFRGLGLAKIFIRNSVSSKKLDWNYANAILWGVYWQDMRKALKYNLFTAAYAQNENTFFSSVAFVFYTEAFFGNVLSLMAMNKLVHSEEVEKSGLKQNFLVWLGVANQMNGNVSECMRSHALFSSTAKNPDPFQVLISKASILNMSISELGPYESSIALEDCFRVSCSLNNSRNHIQLYGAKTVLLALEGNLQSAKSFCEKAKQAAHANDNTLDWIIFSRLSCIYFLTIEDWVEFDKWHKKMKVCLKAYAPISWYTQEYKRLLMVSIFLRKNRKISVSLLRSIFSSILVFQPFFFWRDFKKVVSVLTSGSMAYWSQEALLRYYCNLRTRNFDSLENDQFKSIVLSLENLITGQNEVDLSSSIKDLSRHIGSELVLIESDMDTLVKKAAEQLGFNPNNTLTRMNDGSRRFFIDNKGFFVAHSVYPKSEIKPFAYGMLFKVLDVHTLEAYDLISNLSVQYLTAVESIKRNSELLAQAKILSEKAELAAQVSHDIRSPLSALTMISGYLPEVPEEKRLIIRNAAQRINDIANQLLAKSKEIQNRSIEVENKNRVVLLSAVIDVLVSEKRTQYRNKMGISIEVDLKNSYGVFALINPIEIKRVLSNLINNSVEAFEQSKGLITVGITCTEDKAVLYIRDNGRGIPDYVLKRLGQSGVTHGKEGFESGSGLGIYHAKKTIESLGGELEIQSSVGKGTTIDIHFCKVSVPEWFTEKLALLHGQNVVCIDDDLSIHQIWAKRFGALSNAGQSVNLVNLSSSEELELWLKNNKDKANKSLFLVDFEFLGQSKTGLDLIEKFGLADKAVLVTSRFEESSIQARCAHLGLKLIPKELANLIPIEVETEKNGNDVWLTDENPLISPSNSTNSYPAEVADAGIKYDLCLIDDDSQLIHPIWDAVAKDKGLNIKMFTTPHEFISAADEIDRLTPIYIDVSLGNGIRGTDFAHEVYKLGFTEINLATGYEKDAIEVPTFIRQVVGKNFPEYEKSVGLNF